MIDVSRRSFEWVVLFGIPIGLGLFIVGTPLVTLLFGDEFIPSGIILSLFGIVLILTYLNIYLGLTLISMDRHNHWTAVMAAATLVTIPLDLWLIPWASQTYGNGGIGGALSFMVTEGAMVICGFALLPKGILDRSSAWMALRASLAGLVMVAAAWRFRDQSLFVQVLVGMIVYSLMAWLLRLVRTGDVATLLRAALSVLRPVPES
jgi:O-antigen/teichoic acid export membrane protein